MAHHAIHVTITKHPYEHGGNENGTHINGNGNGNNRWGCDMVNIRANCHQRHQHDIGRIVNIYVQMGEMTMMRKFKLMFITPLVALSYWATDLADLIKRLADAIYDMAECINDHNIET